jgi:type IV secretory pathway TraG/TraD family ATPase VirD4
MGFPNKFIYTVTVYTYLGDTILYKYLKLLPDKKILLKMNISSPFNANKFLISLDKYFKKLNDKHIINFYNNSKKFIYIYPRTSLLIFTVILSLYFIFFIILSYYDYKTKFIRGAKIIPFNDFLKRLNKLYFDNFNIKIGNLIFPRKVETSHLLILGATGSGKTVLLNQFIDAFFKRNIKNKKDRFIFYDIKGDFTSVWKKRNDLLFFPFDRRCVRYSIFNDIFNDVDFDIIARSIFEPAKEGRDVDVFFEDASAQVFKTGLIFLYKNKKKKNTDILDFFSYSREKIIEKFLSLPHQYHMAINFILDSRTGASVLANLCRKISFVEYLKDLDGDFSFRKFITEENIHNNLFIPNISRYKKIFKPLFTFIIDILIREVLSLEDNLNRRIYFIIDEFGSLNKIDSIFNCLKEGRSKGAVLIVGNQDLGDIESLYGKCLTNTFYNNFNSHFFLRLNDPNTCDFISKAIGEAELYKQMKTSQVSPKSVGDRQGQTTHDKIDRSILPSELMNLADLNSILKISNVGITKFKIPAIYFQKNTSPFIEREFSDVISNFNLI